jgi:hypothetical protein
MGEGCVVSNAYDGFIALNQGVHQPFAASADKIQKLQTAEWLERPGVNITDLFKFLAKRFSKNMVILTSMSPNYLLYQYTLPIHTLPI